MNGDSHVNIRVTIILFLTLSLVTVLKTEAQSPQFKEYLLQEDGRAKLMIEDLSGFLWVGTFEGLYSFDGVEWEPYSRQDSGKTEEVTALFQAKDSTIWVGYADGKIYQIDDNKMSPFSPEEGLPVVPITGFQEDNSGNLWFGTYGEGVYYFWNDRLYNVDTDDGLPAGDIYAVSRDHLGRIWVGTDRGIGICYLDKGTKKVEILDTERGLPDNIVRAIQPAKETQGMWIGMYDGGVSYYDVEKGRFTTYAGWESGTTNCILPMGKSVWIGTERNGLIALENGLYRKVADCKKISCITTDREGNIWLADQTEKLRMSVQAIRRIPGLEENILSIHDGSEGNLWYSTEKGLFVFNRYQQEIKAIWQHSLFRITSIYEDRTRNQLWIGTLGEGVWRMDLRTGERQLFQEKNGLVNNHVMSIDGNQSEIWFGTFGGVSRLLLNTSNSGFENFTGRDGLGSDYIYKVLVDSRGRVWFATDGKGVSYWEHEMIRTIDEWADRTILSISEDHKGTIWASTDDGQIYSYNDQTFRLLKKYDTNASMVPSGLVSNQEGNLVIVYADHVDVYYPKSEKLTRFDENLGLLPPGEDLNVMDVDSDGHIWIGTRQGINWLDIPSENTIIHPTPRIKDVKIYLEEIGNRDPMHLSADENHLVFEFVGIWYQNPQDVGYEHRLMGYDTTWVKTKDHQAIFANLDPGDYQFELRAVSNLTHNYSPVTVYRFHIQKPFWLTWWFLLLSAAFISALIWKWIKIREERLRKTERLEQEKVRSRFETLQSQINPHFLFNSFNTLVSIIEDDQEVAVEYVEKLSDFFRNILAYRDRQLITLNEELMLFEDFHYLQKKRFGDNFQLQLDIDADLMDRMIPTLTLQLLVENVFKHNVISRSKPLYIYIETKAPGYLTVRNNLQKRKYELPSTKVGLENIAQRYQLLTQQEVKIDITESEFSVHIPLLNHAIS